MSIFTKLGESLGWTKAKNNHDLWIELRSKKGGVRDYLRSFLGWPISKETLPDITPLAVGWFLKKLQQWADVELTPAQRSLFDGFVRELLGK